MHRTIIFTGAGASYPFGFPRTGDLFPRIRDEINKSTALGESPAHSPKNDALRGLLVSLLPGFENASELPYITDVLSLIDYSLLVATTPIPQKTAQDLVRFRVLIEEAIFHALQWPYDRHNPPASLQRLAGWIAAQGGAPDREISLISTNYDIAVDDLLFRVHGTVHAQIARTFDFGTTWRTPGGIFCPRPARPAIRLYKLHGSLNWLRCDLCEHIYVNVHGTIAHQAFREGVDDHNTCDCGHAPLRAVLVAPSLVRDVRDVNLLEIWKNSLEVLRQADEWIMIGYSFAAEDIAIRSMFMRAYQGRPANARPLVRVVQRARDAAMEARYRLFFPKCTFEYGGIEAFIGTLPAHAA